jgi:ArsR family transcriptional regulator
MRRSSPDPALAFDLYFEYIRSSLVTTKLERHAGQLSALGHPVRLSILRIVVQGGPEGTSAGDIQTRVDMPASTLSHHLSRLLQAGLLTTRGEGTFHYYAADYDVLRALTDYLWEDCCKAGGKCC